MSNFQKKSFLSNFITFPLAGAALGAGADYLFGRKSMPKRNKGADNEEAIKADNKERVRRLLRSLILGGGLGLGVATMYDGGKRLIDVAYGVDDKGLPKIAGATKGDSFKKKASSNKLLKKLVKKAAEESFFSNPNVNYALAGGASMLGSLGLYTFLNDKKKRNLLGYLGSGLVGLGSGLASAGLYNKNTYGGFFGKPKEDTGKDTVVISDTTKKETPIRKSPPKNPENGSLNLIPPVSLSPSKNTNNSPESTAKVTKLKTTTPKTTILSGLEVPTIIDEDTIVIPEALRNPPVSPAAPDSKALADQVPSNGSNNEKVKAFIEKLKNQQKNTSKEYEDQLSNSDDFSQNLWDESRWYDPIALGAEGGVTAAFLRYLAKKRALGKGNTDNFKFWYGENGPSRNPAPRPGKWGRAWQAVEHAIPGLNTRKFYQLGNKWLDWGSMPSDPAIRTALEVANGSGQLGPNGYSGTVQGEPLSPSKRIRNAQAMIDALAWEEAFNQHQRDIHAHNLAKTSLNNAINLLEGHEWGEIPEEMQKLLLKDYIASEGRAGRTVNPADISNFTFRKGVPTADLFTASGLQLNGRGDYIANKDLLDRIQQSLPEEQATLFEQAKFIENPGEFIHNELPQQAWDSAIQEYENASTPEAKVNAYNKLRTLAERAEFIKSTVDPLLRHQGIPTDLQTARDTFIGSSNATSDSAYENLRNAVDYTNKWLSTRKPLDKLKRNGNRPTRKLNTGLTGELVREPHLRVDIANALEAVNNANDEYTIAKKQYGENDPYTQRRFRELNSAEAAYNQIFNNAETYGQLPDRFGNRSALLNEQKIPAPELRGDLETLIRNLDAGTPLAPEQLPERLFDSLSDSGKERFNYHKQLQKTFIEETADELARRMSAEVGSDYGRGLATDLEELKENFRQALIRKATRVNPNLGRYLQQMSSVEFDNYMNQSSGYQGLKNWRNSFASSIMQDIARNTPTRPDPRISDELRENVRNQGDLVMHEAIERVDKAYTILNEYSSMDSTSDITLESLRENYRQAVDNLKTTYKTIRGSNVSGGRSLADIVLGRYTGNNPYSPTGSPKVDFLLDTLNLPNRNRRVTTEGPTLFDNVPDPTQPQNDNVGRPQETPRPQGPSNKPVLSSWQNEGAYDAVRNKYLATIYQYNRLPGDQDAFLHDMLKIERERIKFRRGTPQEAIDAIDAVWNKHFGNNTPNNPSGNPVQNPQSGAPRQEQQPTGEQSNQGQRPKPGPITDADLELVDEIIEEEAKKDKEYRRKEVIRETKKIFSDPRWKGVVRVDDNGEVHKLNEQRYNEIIQELEAERAKNIAELQNTRNMTGKEVAKRRKAVTTLDWVIENARRFAEGTKKVTKPILKSR